VFAFESAAFAPHLPALYAFIALLALSTFAPVLKFGRPGSYHLYLFKLTAVVQAVAILWLFTVGFSVPLFYLAMGVGILACLEDLAVTLVLKVPVSDARSLFWLLRRPRG
jgi:CDP-diacylglycerol--glycerol-3-phosphate 3-phosphatidyltransferase